MIFGFSSAHMGRMDFVKDKKFVKKAFPQLESIAISSIYGKVGDRWR
jgi:hypothetical protein